MNQSIEYAIISFASSSLGAGLSLIPTEYPIYRDVIKPMLFGVLIGSTAKLTLAADHNQTAEWLDIGVAVAFPFLGHAIASAILRKSKY